MRAGSHVNTAVGGGGIILGLEQLLWFIAWCTCHTVLPFCIFMSSLSLEPGDPLIIRVLPMFSKAYQAFLQKTVSIPSLPFLELCLTTRASCLQSLLHISRPLQMLIGLEPNDDNRVRNKRKLQPR